MKFKSCQCDILHFGDAKSRVSSMYSTFTARINSDYPYFKCLISHIWRVATIVTGIDLSYGHDYWNISLAVKFFLICWVCLYSLNLSGRELFSHLDVLFIHSFHSFIHSFLLIHSFIRVKLYILNFKKYCTCYRIKEKWISIYSWKVG